MTPSLFELDPAEVDRQLEGRTSPVRRVVPESKDALVEGVLRRLGSRGLYVQLRRHLDSPEYVVSTLAAQCGAPACSALKLVMDQDREPDRWFVTLQPFLEAKRVVVSIEDGSEHDRDLRAALSTTWTWRQWAKQQDALVFVGKQHKGLVPCVEPVRDQPWRAETIWNEVKHDARSYTLAVAHELLIGPMPRGNALRRTGGIAAALWQALPGELGELLRVLAVHERPIARADFLSLGLVGPDVVANAVDCHLVQERAGALVLAPTLAELVEPQLVASTHLRLAQAFERALAAGTVDPVVAVIEAHRHYAAVPQPDKAFELMHYGLNVLLGMAASQSRANAWKEAAQSYQRILEASKKVPASSRFRGYATHYQHYNRYKAEEETLAETIQGYQASCELWPDNALFTSRLVRALFLDQREDDALQAFRQGASRVSWDHCTDALVNRPLRRLIARKLIAPALALLQELPPGVSPDPVLANLVNERAKAGWTTRRLWLPKLLAVNTAEPLRCNLARTSAGMWTAQVGSDVGESPSRFDALLQATRGAAFAELASRWISATGHISSRQTKFEHADYQQILKLGQSAVPHILSWIQAGGRGHWDEALKSLAASSPPNLTGPLSAVMQSWVRWGVEQHWIPPRPDESRVG